MRKFRRPIPAALAVLMAVAGIAAFGIVEPATGQAATTGSQTFTYSASTQTFTVPAGVTQLTVTLTGGEGGRGGADSNGPSPAGGYVGVVTGTIAVTPTQVITIGVGQGGATGADRTHAVSASDFTTGAAVAGTNPISGYQGGNGGVAGQTGSSGDGGAGGAATVITYAGTTLVAGGSGGAGGSGQFAPLLGHIPASSFTGYTPVTTTGQLGLSVGIPCQAPGSVNCDGGGGGGGGGGAQGGQRGDVQFGSGSSTEWFGFGGSPGLNSTASIGTLSGSYAPYADNSSNGSVVFAWSAGVPDAPTSVTGTAGNQSVGVSWTPPVNNGGSAITDYIVRYALATNPTAWTSVDTHSASTSATITGLTNGLGYIFAVDATNSTGTGAWSASSGTITPIGPPAAPSITGIIPADGALSVAFSQPTGGATVLGYQYSLDGGSTWISAGPGVTTSPLTIPGLTNGTAYSVEIRAVSSVGNTGPSSPVSGTPAAVPGAPTITSISTSPEAASVSFTPGYSGGGTITGYEYQLNSGAWVSAGTTSPIAITGLADGTTYTVAIRTDSAAGPSSASLTSSFTTPSVPGAPAVTVTRGDSQLSIAWTAGSPGGSTITGYQYSLDGGSTWTGAGSSPTVVTGLNNGQAYSVSVRALNVIGAGAGSPPQSATPATVPSAPTITSNNVAGSGQLSVNFSAPTSNGGATITNYQYSTDGGATWRAFSPATTSSPAVISTLSSDGTTALSNTTYPIELRAVNSAGAGVASATNDGTPLTIPVAPTITTVTTGSGSLQVTFTPAANGGSPITGYEYTLNGGSVWQSTGTLGSTFTITGLTNGTSYPVQVQAINALGDSLPSNVFSATPSTTPAQPVITGVVRSNHTLTVSVTDANNGGAAITDYQYSTDGGTTWHTAGSATSPLTITTLSTNGTTQIQNGTSYPIEVRAVNAAGVSVASTTTNVGPAAPPSAPIVSLAANNQAITVTFSIVDDGGSPVSAIEYQLNSGAWVNAGTLSSPFTISGLTNGTAYTVNVRADNAIGNGTPSNPAVATPFTVPGAPTTVVAISDTASADVSWTAPTDNGGSAITGYTATAYTDPAAGSAIGTACVTPAGTTSCTIAGLTNGTTYYISVVANNAAGSGLPSSPRDLVIPLARPTAPSLTGLAAGDTYLNVTFGAANLNSSALVSYQYQLNGGAWVNTSSAPGTFQITGLTDGTNYTVAMRAVTMAGTGPASTTLTATPFGAPAAPISTSVTTAPGNASVIVSWTAAANNGSAITGYSATAFSLASNGTVQGTVCTTTGALSCTVTGLTNGTTYYFAVQATNAAGTSPRSDPRVAGTPAAVPNAPAAPTVTAGDTQASLSWTAPGNNGSAITDYKVYYSSDGVNYTLFNDGVSTGTTATVTGLTNGTSYTFEVAAVNGNGTGPLSPASSSITPLTTGTTPTLSAATSTNTGYTFTITNYDAGTTYTFAATNGATATRSGSTVTVSGLAAGASSTVTVSAAKSGFSTTTAPITGSAIPAGTVPTFGGVNRLADGYYILITNYDAASTYAISASVGSAVVSTAVGSAGLITVSGVSPGVTSTVTVTVTKSGFQNAVGTYANAALGAGTPPTFTNLVRNASGFTVTIANYNGSLTYGVFGAPGTWTQSGSLLTVTGLSAGQSSTATVYAVSSTTFASSSYTAAALATGVTPTLSAATSTATGYTFTITNYDSNVTYSVSSSAGSASVDSSGIVTVTGLSNGASAVTTVNATRTGYTATSAQQTGSALLTGTTPTVSPRVPTATGYVFSVTNYDSGSSYAVSADSGASATIDSSGNVTVTGLTNGASATTTVTAARTGYTNGVTTTSGTALLTGSTPTLSSATPTATGYTFSISNYSPSYSYAVSAGGGASATVDSSGNVTVTGLTNGASATTTVTSSRSGYTSLSAPITASALLTGVTPILATALPTPTGFIVFISNYDANYTYNAITTAGTVAVDSVGDVTVTGLSNGATATVTVSATRAGYTPTSAQQNGAALLTGTAPTFSPSVSVATGYTFTITNYISTNSSYPVSADNGATATVDSSGNVTVTGLTNGASATTTVTARHTGYTAVSATTTGSALITGLTPTAGSFVSTATGYTFTITNYDSNYTYGVTADNGATATVDSSGNVTVTGLTNGASATTTVTVSRSGYTTTTTPVSLVVTADRTTPTLSAPVSTQGGFIFSITNYDPNQSYAPTIGTGTATIDPSGVVTVSGLADGASQIVSITASRVLYTSVSAKATGSALQTGTGPTVSDATRTDDGFTFTITNFDPAYTYTATTTDGTVVVDSTGLVTVTGLAPTADATVIVTATQTGHLDSAASVHSSALATGSTPTFSTPKQTADGFTFTITNFDPAYTYTFAAAPAGTVTVGANGVVTVTGLDPGTSTTVTVTATQDGHAVESAAITGTALSTGTTPKTSTPVPTTDGYTFDITNYDPDSTYTVTAPDGAKVTIDDKGHVTVTGLSPSASGTITITVRKNGSTDAKLAVTAAAADPAPSADAAPTTSELPPGDGAATQNGVVVESTVTPTATSVLLTGVDGITLEVSAYDGGAPIALDGSKVVTVTQQGQLRVSVNGFKAGTTATVWGFSTPTMLAHLTIYATQDAAEYIVLPASMLPGNHTLVVTGTSVSGKAAQMKVGIVVAPPKHFIYSVVPTATNSDPSWLWWMLPIIAALAIGAPIFLMIRRRRHQPQTA